MSDSWLAERRQPRDSLATKIIFFVFLSTFVTSLVVSWVAVHSTYSFLRAHLERLHPAVLAGAERSLDHARSDARILLARLARDPALPRLLADGGAGGEALLQEALAEGRGLAALTLRDLSGAVRAGTAGVDGAAAPPRADGSLQRNGDRLFVAAPIRDAGGRALGALEATLAPLPEVLGLEDPDLAGWVHLVDGDGTVLARGGREPADAFLAFPAAALSDDGHEPRRFREIRAADGRRAVGASAALGGTSWSLVVAQPIEHAYAPVFAVVTRIFVIDLAVVLLFSFLAYEITSAIVRPLEQLSDAARRISQGELEVEIADQRRRDEIGLLTRTFNDMARRLRRNRAEIEQQHRQLREQNEQLQQANEVLEQLSITDGLTKLHNHRYFQETLTREIKRVSRTGERLAMLLIDIDDFKALNDRLGHAAGDAVLVRIARILNESVRESDVLARYGGEEFVVLAPGTDLEGAAYLAEKVRTAVAEASFGIDVSGEAMRVTVSIGVAEYAGDRRGFFDTADRALYRAKAAGKNCVVGPEELASV
jgi:diguanylate cyclase (GGDEF)-like protein